MVTELVQFRPFEPEDTEAAVRLLSIGRCDSYCALKRRIFDWQFFANPYARQPALLVGELDGTIVALNGFMPARARFHHRVIDACWSCDTYVSSDLRGKGIGKQLITRVSHAAPVMLGYGISDMSDPIFEKLGWRKHPEVRLLFFHCAERGVTGSIKNAVSKLAGLRAPRLTSGDYEIANNVSARTLGELDELWARNAHGYPSSVERDGAYLQWKYFQHPCYAYRLFAIRRRGVLLAIMIARHDAEESVIVDYSGPADDEVVMATLAAEVVRDLEATGTARVRCETTHKPLLDALRRVGFISSRYASRFRIRVNEGELDPLRGWLLMPGDSDGDLLVTGR
jgi:GNAT superfamily N-acetyltransferase